MHSLDDTGWNSFYANFEKVASVRILLGLEPYGHLRGHDDTAFRGIISDVVDEALGNFVKCPERVETFIRA